MRQKSTVIASSRRGSEWVCWVWAIRGSFRRGFGWPPLYSQSTQHTSSVSVRSATLLLLRTLIPCVVASVVTSEFLSKELFVVTFLRCFRQVRGTARASFPGRSSFSLFACSLSAEVLLLSLRARSTNLLVSCLENSHAASVWICSETAILASADGFPLKKPSGSMGNMTFTAPRWYLPPTMLSALRMLWACTPTWMRAAPLLTSTETFTICCSITFSPSLSIPLVTVCLGSL